MWQQSSSTQAMAYPMAMTWVHYLNKCGFAGFTDWRLPTLEEALTLLQDSPSSAGLYIDPISMPSRDCGCGPRKEGMRT